MFDKGSILCTQFGNCPKLCTLRQQVHIWQLLMFYSKKAYLKQMLYNIYYDGSVHCIYISFERNLCRAPARDIFRWNFYLIIVPRLVLNMCSEYNFTTFPQYVTSSRVSKSRKSACWNMLTLKCLPNMRLWFDYRKFNKAFIKFFSKQGELIHKILHVLTLASWKLGYDPLWITLYESLIKQKMWNFWTWKFISTVRSSFRNNAQVKENVVLIFTLSKTTVSRQSL